MKKKHIDSLLGDWRSIMSKDGNEKVARLLVIGELFNNNAELFKLITKQIYLLEKYKEFIDTIADTDEYIDEFN